MFFHCEFVFDAGAYVPENLISWKKKPVFVKTREAPQRRNVQVATEMRVFLFGGGPPVSKLLSSTSNVRIENKQKI